MTQLPRAMLIDMDDTILSAYGRPEIAWNKVAAEFAGEFAPLLPHQVATAVLESARKFWASADAEWRLKLAEARQVVVRNGFTALAVAGQPALPMDLALRFADRFTAYREEEMFVFPGAHDAIDALKAHGVKLALVTNGAAEIQRAKVERFALTHRFDHIQIEGEHGFGKPDERAYLHAMQALGVTAPETWMIGDNLEWEIEVPQRLGIYAIWIDAHGEGLPAGTSIKPDRIIRSLKRGLIQREIRREPGVFGHGQCLPKRRASAIPRAMKSAAFSGNFGALQRSGRVASSRQCANRRRPPAPTPASAGRGSALRRAGRAVAARSPRPCRRAATSDGPWNPAPWFRHWSAASASQGAWRPR